MHIKLAVDPDPEILRIIAKEMVTPGQGAKSVYAAIIRYHVPEASWSDMFEPLSKAGWLLNNLFQLDDGTWRASIRNAAQQVAYEFGDGTSPDKALQTAMQKALGSKGTQVRHNAPRAYAEPGRKIEASSGADLLGKLGIKL